MNTFAPLPADRVSPHAKALDRMPAADFIARWRLLTGEPPAVMLDSRSEMLALMVESVPAAPLTLAEAVARLSVRSPCQIQSDACTHRSMVSNVLVFRPREGRHSLKGCGEDRVAS